MSTPRFLADEDFRHRIIKAARRLEPAIEIATVVEHGLKKASDEAVLKYAQIKLARAFP